VDTRVDWGRWLLSRAALALFSRLAAADAQPNCNRNTTWSISGLLNGRLNVF
jgi:hypothetical protein